MVLPVQISSLLSVDPGDFDVQFDNPEYKANLFDAQEDLDSLASRLKKLIKVSKNYVAKAAALAAVGKELAKELVEFGNLDKKLGDEVIDSAMSSFGKTIEATEEQLSILGEQLTHVFIEPMESFLTEEIAASHSARKTFDKNVSDYESALGKYYGLSRSVDPAKAREETAAYKHSFLLSVYDYSEQLSSLHTRKSIDFLERLCACMVTRSAYFHQGYDAHQELEEYVLVLTKQLQDQRVKFLEDQNAARLHREKADEMFRQCPPIKLLRAVPEPGTETNTEKEAYVFKRSNNIVHDWSRRYLRVAGGQLSYFSTRVTRSRRRTSEEQIPLLLCTVRPSADIDRRGVFEIVSPKRSFLVQGRGDEDAMHWMQVFSNATSAALDESELPELPPVGEHLGEHATVLTEVPTISPEERSKHNDLLREQLLAVEGNEVCADCGAPGPKWASINVGVVLCLRCSGLHRGLGTHISKVRSLSLDEWPNSTHQILMRLGNLRVNAVLEGMPMEDEEHPTVDSGSAATKAFVVAKYDKKQFVSCKKDVDLWNRLCDCVEQNDLVGMMECWAQGLDISEAGAHQARQPLLLSVQVPLEIMEWLLLNRIPVNVTDENQGKTALHLAAQVGDVGRVRMLIRYGANVNQRDKEGRTALDAATEALHTDTVLLLSETLANWTLDEDERITHQPVVEVTEAGYKGFGSTAIVVEEPHRGGKLGAAISWLRRRGSVEPDASEKEKES